MDFRERKRARNKPAELPAHEIAELDDKIDELNGAILRIKKHLKDKYNNVTNVYDNEYIDLGSKIQTLSRGKDEIDELFKKILEKAVPNYRANNNWIRDKGEEEERIEDKITELRRSMITLFDELEGIHKKMKTTKRNLNSGVIKTPRARSPVKGGKRSPGRKTRRVTRK
jgi:chromosome segregation ATPase